VVSAQSGALGDVVLRAALAGPPGIERRPGPTDGVGALLRHNRRPRPATTIREEGCNESGEKATSYARAEKTGADVLWEAETVPTDALPAAARAALAAGDPESAELSLALRQS
jgi:hypothetical protein